MSSRREVVPSNPSKEGGGFGAAQNLPKGAGRPAKNASADVLPTVVNPRGLAPAEPPDSSLALRNQDVLYRALLSLHAQAGVGILLYAAERKAVVHANDAACRILGYSLKELEEIQSIFTLLAPEEVQKARERHEARLRGEAAESHFETAVRHKKGHRVDLEVTVQMVDLEGQVHLLLLLRDVTARRVVEKALKEAASLLEATLEATADGLLVVDLKQRATRYNRKFVDMWRIPEDVLQSPLAQDSLRFMGQQLKDAAGFVARVQELAAHVDHESYDVLEFEDGRVFERYSTPQRVGGIVVGRVYSFRDVTKRKRAEDTLRKRADQVVHHQRILLEMTKKQADDVLEAFTQLVELDARTLQVDRVSIWLFNPERTQIFCQELFTLSKGLHERGVVLEARSFPAYFQALEESRTIAADDASNDPRTREFRTTYLEPLGITSMLDVPIRLHGRVLGVVCHEHTGAPRQWTLEEQDFAAEVANLVALSIEAAQRKRAEEQVRHLNQLLEERVRIRTSELQSANRELEAFSYSVSHDLRQPLRTIDGFSQALVEDYGPRLDDEGKHLVQRIRAATQRMAHLIDDLLNLSRVSQGQLHRATVDLSTLARAIADRLHQSDPARRVEFAIEQGLKADGDPQLLTVALENLVGNAWKYASRREVAHISFGTVPGARPTTYFVKDDGAGFDPALIGRLFLPFQRLHHSAEFEGSGIGLATVQRILHRHGGRAWAEGAPDQGATFYFTLGHEPEVV